MEQLKQGNIQKERVIDFHDDDDYFNDTAEEKELSTQILQMQKNQLIDLKEHFQRYCTTLSVFGFNSAKYDINLVKSYLFPLLVNERQIEPRVFWKAYQFVSSLVMCSYLIFWTSLVGPLVLTRSSKLTK